LVELGQPAVNNDETLAWDTTMVGFSCLVAYTFADNRLVSGGYLFDDPDDGMDGVVYTRLSESLTAKYGDVAEHIQWLNPIRRVNVETIGDLGNAAGAHYLSANRYWQTATQNIALRLVPKDGEYGAQVLLTYHERPANKGYSPAVTDLNLL